MATGESRSAFCCCPSCSLTVVMTNPVDPPCFSGSGGPPVEPRSGLLNFSPAEVPGPPLLCLCSSELPLKNRRSPGGRFQSACGAPEGGAVDPAGLEPTAAAPFFLRELQRREMGHITSALRVKDSQDMNGLKNLHC